MRKVIIKVKMAKIIIMKRKRINLKSYSSIEVVNKVKKII